MLTYLNYQLNRNLGKLYEYTLYYNEEFDQILRNMSEEGDLIATDLLSIQGEDNKDTDVNYIDVDSNVTKNVSYKIDSKIDKILKTQNKDINDNDDRRDASERVPTETIKVGRMIQRLATLTNKTYKASDVEKFINKYIAIQSGKDYNFKILEGDDISEAYLSENYREAEGELNGSCMVDHTNYLDIYYENPEVCSLLTLYDSDNMIVGRAFLWETNIGTVMDKIYTALPSLYPLFVKYANEKNIPYRCTQNNRDNSNKWKFKLKNKDVELDNLFVKLSKWNFQKYPYIDTFSYIDEKGVARNNFFGLESYTYCNSTSGSRDRESGMIYYNKIVNMRGEVVNKRAYSRGESVWDMNGDTEYVAGISEDGRIHSIYRHNEDTVNFKGNIYHIPGRYNGETEFRVNIISLNFKDDVRVLTREHIPDTLKELIVNSGVEEIEYLPEGIEVIDLMNSAVEKLPEIPSSVISLDLYGCGITDIKFKPDSRIEYLNIGGTKIGNIDNLPDSIQHLTLNANVSLSRIKKFPSSLIKLDMKQMTMMRTIDSFPPKLRKLELVGNINIKELPKLPGSLEKLDLYNCENLEKIVNLPSKLVYIDLRNTSLPVQDEAYGIDNVRSVRRIFKEKKKDK